MFSSAAIRLRSAPLVFGTCLGLSGHWMLLLELLRPKPRGLPFDRDADEAASARWSRAVVAAETGALKGGLWAEAAFTGARLMGTDRSTSLDRINCGQLARARTNAEEALARAPGNGAAWLYLARLPAISRDGENRVGNLLEMSYFNAPSALDLVPWRLERGNFKCARGQGPPGVHQEPGIVDRGPEFQQAIVAAYRDARPRNRPIFESLVADVEATVGQLLRCGQPK
ncbi:MAG: hypothetical protein ACREC9_14510 [Methylocella sp.]